MAEYYIVGFNYVLPATSIGESQYFNSILMYFMKLPTFTFSESFTSIFNWFESYMSLKFNVEFFQDNKCKTIYCIEDQDFTSNELQKFLKGKSGSY